jgi:Effector Associated Constant Component 1
MDRTDPREAQLSVSDHSQLGSLADYLRLAVPDALVTRVPGRPGPGEQGAFDVVMILADSSVLVAALKVLPTFLRSRKTDVSVTVRVKGKRLTLTAASPDEVTRVIERFFDG